jgi:hypothetical protein
LNLPLLCCGPDYVLVHLFLFGMLLLYLLVCFY